MRRSILLAVLAVTLMVVAGIDFPAVTPTQSTTPTPTSTASPPSTPSPTPPPSTPSPPSPALSIDIPSQGQVRIDTAQFPDGPVRFTLIDPVTGEVHSSGQFTVQNEVAGQPSVDGLAEIAQNR